MKNNFYLIVCACLLLGAFIIRNEFKSRHPDPDVITREELPVILEAVELYQHEMTNFPPALLGSNTVSLYESLTTGKRPVRYLSENARWDKAGKLVDFWGNEYRMQATVTNQNGSQVCVLKAWSCGPSGKDQSGEGDNIQLTRTWPKQP